MKKITKRNLFLMLKKTSKNKGCQTYDGSLYFLGFEIKYFSLY